MPYPPGDRQKNHLTFLFKATTSADPHRHCDTQTGHCVCINGYREKASNGDKCEVIFGRSDWIVIVLCVGHFLLVLFVLMIVAYKKCPTHFGRSSPDHSVLVMNIVI